MKKRRFACCLVGTLLAVGAIAAASSASSASRTTRLTPKAEARPAAAIPPPQRDADTGRDVVAIAPDWKLRYPFSARFPVSTPLQKANAGDALAHVIDLEAIYFATDALVSRRPDGSRAFAQPDLSSFAPELVREPFSADGLDYFVVQAASPAGQAELRAWLVANRVAVLGYVPNLAYVVRLSPAGAEALRARPEVFWLGAFHPAFRVQPKLDYIVESDAGFPVRMTAIFDAALQPSLDGLLASVKGEGLEVLASAPVTNGWLVRVEGPAGKARSLVRMPGCLWTERYVEPRLHNDVARTSQSVATGRGAANGPIMDVEDVWARGIRGEGQIAAAADTGLDTGNLTTADSMHWDFGQLGSATNPLRVIKGYALGRATWDDPNPNGGHGTHTSGSIVGNGVRSGANPGTNTFPTTSHAGTAPKAGFVFQSIMDSGGALGGIPTNLNSLFQPPYNDGARVHSNSWGSDANGQYTTRSQQLDEFVWNNKDMVITFSAGNSGQDGRDSTMFGCANNGQAIDGVIDPDTMGAPATAKNCITVGASENYRPTFLYEFPANTCAANQNTWGWFNGCAFSTSPISTDLMANNANGMGAFSSRGPTDDGRFKPDVVAPGIAIVSTRTSVNQQYEQWGICIVPSGERPYYLTQGGTSMSNPLTAGAAVLVRQYYADGWHPNGTATTHGAAVPVDGFNPSSSLVKATLINGAWDMAPGQYGTGATREIPAGWDTGATLPNNAEGFGRVDLEHSLFPGSGYGDVATRRMAVYDVTPGLTTGVTANYTFTVGGSGNPLIVTLVWSDPFAASGAGTKLVNNLDLIVMSPSGTRYYVNGVDKTTGSNDNLNNVEQVKVTNPETGIWTIQVVGTNVPGNAVAGTTTQPYALVASGPSCAAAATPTDVAASATGNNAITVSWTSSGATSYNVYRSTTSGSNYALQGNTTGTSFVDATASTGITYYYVVRGVNSCAESGNSAEVSATAGGPCDTPPTFAGLASVANSGGSSCSLTLSWSAGTSPCGTLAYSVYRSTSSGFTPSLSDRIAVGVTGTSYVDAGNLAIGTTYYYVVRATAAGVEETNAVERSGVPAPTTVTLFSDNFDGGRPANASAYYIETAAVGADQLSLSTCRSASTTTSYKFGAPGVCPGSTTSNVDSHLTVGGDGSAMVSINGFAIPAGASTVRLRFNHYYALGSSDGTSLDYSTTSATSGFASVPSGVTAGQPYISSGGYNGTAGGRAAWVGTIAGSPSFGAVVVNADALAGQTVWFRWRSTTNAGNNGEGYYVDDIVIDYSASCSTAPQRVRIVTVTSTSGQNKIEWVNPSTGAYGSTRIMVRTDGTFPTGPADPLATLVATQAGPVGGHDSYLHTGLANGTTYSYAAFVDNGSGSFSQGRSCAGRPQDTTGPVKWIYSTSAASVTAPTPWPASPGGSAYVVSNDRHLHAVKSGLTGGDWPTTWLPLPMNGPSQARAPVVQTPLIPSATRVIFIGSQDGHVYAANAETGAMLWSSPVLGDQVQAAPIVILTDYGAPFNLLLVGSRTATGASKFYALNITSGAILWTFDNSMAQGGDGLPMGIVSRGASMDFTNLGNGKRRAYFASRSRGGGSQDTVWCLEFDAAGATRLWSRAIDDVDGSVILFNGRLYVGTNTSRVYALDPVTGANLWGGSGYFDCMDGPVKSYVHPGFVTNRLYISTTNRVWALVDSGASVSLLWSTPASGAGSIPSPSTPLYVPGGPFLWVGASDGKLYQLDSASGALSGAAVTLGAGAAAVGPPGYDGLTNMLYVGTDAGTVYGIAAPLP